MAVFALASAAPTGCDADGADGGILVLKNVHADTDCIATSLDTETASSHGTLDIQGITSYLFIAQMRSRITALDGQEDQRTIITTGAKVDVTFPNSTLFSETEIADLRAQGLTHFKSLFSVPIAPNDGLSDGPFTLIPEGLVEKVAAKIAPGSTTRLETLSTFTIEGDMSGTTVTSQPFSYAVTLGRGITAASLGTCPLPTGTSVREGYACNPFQDGIVDCCTVAGGALQCPATVSSN
jgi:hypothetical protein